MQKTALNETHRKLGAKLVPFAGFEMPVEYSGINDEHMAVRTGVGVFDVSHMGEFWIKGPKAAALVQRISSNNINTLEPGKAMYACMPNATGGIVDDFLIYYYEPEKYMLVVNAANIAKDWAWINQQNESIGAELEDASAQISLLAVQGPKAQQVVQLLTDVDLASIPYYSFATGKVADADTIISATGYTGSGGFELFVYNQDAQKLWDALFVAGKDFDIKAIGLGARDTLRLEKGYCLYGNDIDDYSSPIEAGLSWVTKFVEGNDFVNRTQLEQQKMDGVSKKLMGFVLQERGIPRKGYELQNEVGQIIGTVTSGTMSPMLKQGIGMGYIDKAFASIGATVYIAIRNKRIKATVTKLPFV